MRLINRLFISALSIFLAYYICFAEEQKDVAPDTSSLPQQYLFEAEVSNDGVNVRVDSTTSAEIICTLNKNERLDVLSKLYDWYKIRLPHNAPSFIKKNFVAIEKENVGKILNDDVNIRLRPDLSSPILGRVNKDDLVNILEDNGDWYRIEPVKNSSGWIHSMFVNKVQKKEVKPVSKKEGGIAEERITVEGIIKAKTITRIATHKLICQDRKIYLLKSREANLGSFDSRKIKVTGKLENPTANNPIIEVEKIEALD